MCRIHVVCVPSRVFLYLVVVQQYVSFAVDLPNLYPKGRRIALFCIVVGKLSVVFFWTRKRGEFVDDGEDQHFGHFRPLATVHFFMSFLSDELLRREVLQIHANLWPPVLFFIELELFFIDLNLCHITGMLYFLEILPNKLI
jgi:hypothetical protein